MVLWCGISLAINSETASIAGPVNMLADLDWQPGTDTTLSIANSMARGTADTSTNPRIYKGPVALTGGVSYHLSGFVDKGTATGDLFVRVATDNTISNGTILQTGVSVQVDQTFVAEFTGNFYFGVVAVVSGSGQYFEVTDNFSMVQV